MENLGNLNLFIQAAELGSFVAAGQQAGLSASAVGKAVARIETRLGIRLFHRNTRSMTLTAEGKIYYDRCRRVLEELAAAELELTQSKVELSGPLRISLPHVGMLLLPTISKFVKENPGVMLDLDFTDRVVDVIEEGFDLVIRGGAGTDSGLMRRSLGHFAARIVASPAYLKKFGTPKNPGDLVNHKCLHQKSSTSGKNYEWHFKPLVRKSKYKIPESLRANTVESLLFIAESGLGVACLPSFAVESQIASGSLIPILDRYIEKRGEFAVLWPTNRQLSLRVRAFVDFLAENLVLESKSNAKAKKHSEK